MFVVGWSRMSRSSEIVGLRWRDVHFTSTGELMLYLPRTETDPGAGSWVLLSAPEDRVINPGLCLQQLRDLVRVVDQDDWVFRPSLQAEAPRSKNTVAPRLKKALARAEISGAELYATHSLRRGGATHAAKMGVALRFIKVMGRWKSDTVREYLYTSPEVVWGHSRAMLSV
eukprot:GHUV01030855.1.p1 GENE.GHUV01030855.1~~GHUV01030855.1.p1  ORF type:complete len:171 (+),score=9.83 GHUV01030855.1:874-1386(+)